MKNGIPIMLGYFAVSFALGIAAKNVGMDAIQAGYMSITMLASAGEFAALNLIASTAGVIEAILTCLVVNLRYFLMSCSLLHLWCSSGFGFRLDGGHCTWSYCG